MPANIILIRMMSLPLLNKFPAAFGDIYALSKLRNNEMCGENEYNFDLVPNKITQLLT